MSFDVDPSFRGSGRKWRRRRRWRIARRVLGGLAVAGLLGLGGVMLSGGPGDPDHAAGNGTGGGGLGDDEELVQTQESGDAGITVAAAAAEVFLDIRGEPMILTLATGPGRGGRKMILSAPLDPDRARAGTEVVVLNDMLLDSTQQVRLTIPSSSADLAAFQARRATAFETDPADAAPAEDPGEVEEGSVVTVQDGDSSWGEILGGDGSGTTEVSYVETVIENTTTERGAIPSEARSVLFRDDVTRLSADKDLKTVLEEFGVDTEEAERTVQALTRRAEEAGRDPGPMVSLVTGGLVAIRMSDSRPGAQILQLSIYAPTGYIVSLAQPGPGRFDLASDPWFNDNLLLKAGRAQRRSSERGEVRLKDAVYTTALRNGVPSDLVGEMMVMLARVQDLDQIAGEEDRFRLLYKTGSDGAPAGRILYASLSGPQISLDCYVVPRADDAGLFECFDPKGTGGISGGGAGLGPGFVVPVAGTKTSGFGPRMHPVLGRIINHNGVDWGAPTGTPVHATAGGRVARANRADSYGNIVYIDHPGGVQSRYAHLDKFASGLKEGQSVEAGQLIGFVGTTGRSTGPHLHFEIIMNGTPVDPLTLGASQGGGGAVEALVNRIIQVESAGNARAKNTRSTATGLGQFIDSTWLRMMRTYRPDLVASLSRQELLDLRFDPGMSRTMVTNLARENEAFLRGRRHEITAGRLYLAHFLGPSGADVALRADPAATVLAVMGAGVVNANPFLHGKTIRDLTDWADRKMNSAPARSSVVTAPRVVPAAVTAFKEAVDKFWEAL